MRARVTVNYFLTAAAIVSLGTAWACTQARATTTRLQVVTTVSPITSIAGNVAGAYGDVRGLIPEGADSHTFEPPPSAARVIARADVIFVNGLKLEDPTLKLAKANKRSSAMIVDLGARTLRPRDYIYDFSFPKAAGKPNPHLWTNPPYAKRYAEIIRDTLTARDPRHANVFAANEDVFARFVDSLDHAMQIASATVPERALLTYHDAFAYFARQYHWHVIGAIQPSSFSDPTPRDVARLIEQVRTTHVRAIFGSEVFPSPVLAQIGRETGVRYVDTLRDDDLPGKPGDADHSWLGLMQRDFVTMVGALGGDTTALGASLTNTLVRDMATYPQ